MATFKVSRVETKPYDGQKPGTSGLRKKVKVFAQPHYLQNVVQSSFNALTADRIKGKTRVISGDGRYYSGHAIQATTLRQRTGRFTILSFQSSHNAPSSEPSISSLFTSSVGSPPTHLSHLRLSQRHVTTLNILACAVAISATWLFCSAIPALLAFKRAAESLEKLLDVTREELPDTMAAVRLSGMEISDLTMELSDLGQEITQGVRKSTRAVHMAEDKLRHFAQITSAAPMQEIVSTKITTTVEPALATTSRSIREGIVKGRAVLQSFFALIGFSRLVSNYFSSRSNNK